MYEGHWKGGKKHGDGEFHFQSRGQILKGTWSEGISKCGELFEMKDKTKGYCSKRIPLSTFERLAEFKIDNFMPSLTEQKISNKSI